MSHTYNKQYRPPFPALPVHLITDEVKSGPFEALVDTGADVTFVPSYLLEEIDAQIAFPAAVRSHFGESQPVQLYLVGFQVDQVTLGKTYVVADEVGDEIILGRDVLNKLPIFLDGALQQMDVLDEAVAQRLRQRRP